MSLPTPLSPVSRTLASDFAAHSASDLIVLMAGLVPIKLSIVRSTRPPRQGEAYQRLASGENAPKVWSDGTNVLRRTAIRRAPTVSSVRSIRKSAGQHVQSTWRLTTDFFSLLAATFDSVG